MESFSQEELTNRQAHKIWMTSWVVNNEQEFVDYLMTVENDDAIEEFFNQCHDEAGRFCGGSSSSSGNRKAANFTIHNRNGEMESNPPLKRLSEIIDELDYDDDEHPDVAVSHESGWTLSAHSKGLLVWENIKGDYNPGENEPQHMRSVKPKRLFKLFKALSQGDLERIKKEPWIPGYPQKS